MAPPNNDQGYLRQTKTGTPVDDQCQLVGPLIRRAEWVHVDLLPKKKLRVQPPPEERLVSREKMIRFLRGGERVVVSSLDRLGISDGDIGKTVARIIAKGGSVYVAGSDTTLDAATPHLTICEAAEAAELVLKREVMRKAREVLKASGVKVGRKARMDELTEHERAKLRALWHERPDLTQRAIRDLTGFSPTTMFRYFGSRKFREPQDR